ncbi:S8 family serine peptidase [Actinorhabdospora filicis]|uniref:S8 family serine peptidase n=1 Tax=Actinorhabdospora filicis TaxID=1785913 RepID=UPI002553B7E8|nr:S8 family serine peptidase [Actinorhabdospora filicis]
MGTVRKGRRVTNGLFGALATVLLVLVAPVPAHADSVRDKQWQLDALHARDAWALSTGRGAIVAVVDSGVDKYHVDLRGKVLPGADFVESADGSGGDGSFDPVGHGTSVAALIAGNNDPDGVVGLAYDAQILPVRVLDKENRYDDAGIVARAVRWAVDHGANVINLSLGGVGKSTELGEAIDYALSREVVVVACTGNVDPQKDDAQGVWFPARMPGVVAVSGLAPDGEFWSGALTGTATVLAAPADGLTSAHPQGYWDIQGTSFAAPLVSATAAMIKSRFQGISAADTINRLIFTAADLGKPGRDDVFGFGRVNPAAALSVDVPHVPGNPLLAATDGGGGTHPGASATGAAPPAGDAPDSAAPAAAAAEGPGATPYVLLVAVAVVAAAALTTTLVVLRRQGHRRTPGPY